MMDLRAGGQRSFCQARKRGVLDGRTVVPRAGSVCVFPHGDANGSLLHEGSGVIKGTKYIIRADVLYKLAGGEAAK